MKGMYIMKLKKLVSLLLATVVCASAMLTSCGSKGSSEQPSSGNDSNVSSSEDNSSGDQSSDVDYVSDIETNDDGSINEDLTALELTKLMGNGINLGNTMEAYTHRYGKEDIFTDESENAWGQPITTQEMLDGMKAAGFDSIRIPVAWTNAMSYYEDGDYTIDPAYLDRVEEIINYALNADMYVVINDHWDGSWWGMFGSASEETQQAAMDMYVSMWTQIAERYNRYSDRLIFESANEELGDRLNDKDVAKDSGTLSKKGCYDKANEINQVFVDTIRSTGGNNAKRFLLIAGYNTDITNTCNNNFVMPTDTIENRLLISVHYYTPWNYCGVDSLDHWGSVQDFDEQNSLLEMMTKFTDQGYGVIIGEYGVLPKSGGEYKGDIERWTNNFLDNCDYYNYCPMLWDCSDFFVRRELKMKDDSLAQLYLDRSYSAQSSLTDEEIKANAKAQMDKEYAAAEERAFEGISIPASDDQAIAWIMYSSSDWNFSYCVGDTYDPTEKTEGVIANNVVIEGAGEYSVSLDFSQCGVAKGVSFSALGVSNGESLLPGMIITIDEILINDEPIELQGTPYTSSDDGKCTRVNLYNEWVSSVPDDARTAAGDKSDLTPTPMNLSSSQQITTLTVNFTVTLPE